MYIIQCRKWQFSFTMNSSEKNYIINGENSGPYCSCGLTRKKLKKNKCDGQITVISGGREWRCSRRVSSQSILCICGTSCLKVLISWILVSRHLHCGNVTFLWAGCWVEPHLHSHAWLPVTMAADCKDTNCNHHKHRQTADDEADG